MPKKMRGVYLGIQASYQYTMVGSNIEFPPVAIKIILAKHSVSLCYLEPEFCPIREEKIVKLTREKNHGVRYLQVWVREKGAIVNDEWIINCKMKTIIRKGVFPQPTTVLKRSRKK